MQAKFSDLSVYWNHLGGLKLVKNTGYQALCPVVEIEYDGGRWNQESVFLWNISGDSDVGGRRTNHIKKH